MNSTPSFCDTATLLQIFVFTHAAVQRARPLHGRLLNLTDHSRGDGETVVFRYVVAHVERLPR
jgi:hypothetical protein